MRTAGVELGGTKSIAVLGDGAAAIDRVRIPTTSPAATLGALAAAVAEWHAAAPLAAIGLASFGPLVVERDGGAFGRIGSTPKPGWSGADVHGAFSGLGVPIGLDTDVAAAASAEGRWGAARGCSDHVYLTIGTGVGAGIVAGGRLVHGARHPEAGHLRVRRVSGDAFAGICPFHGDCLEGLVSGPALQARTGTPGAAIPDGHPVWTLAAAEIAEALAMLVLTLSPQRIVIGGGIAVARPRLVSAAATATARLIGGYLPEYSCEAISGVVVPAALGQEAGPLGALALGLAAIGA